MAGLSGVLLIIFALNLNAQPTVEIAGTIGASLVDEVQFAGQEPVDWNKTMSGYNLQAYLLKVGPLQIGAEVGYRYLFWYDISLTQFGFSGGTTTRNVDAMHYMAMGRFNPPGNDNIFVEGGLGVYAFDGFTDLAVAIGGGYKIGLAADLYLPLKVRIDYILDSDAPVIPVGLSGGLGYSF